MEGSGDGGWRGAVVMVGGGGVVMVGGGGVVMVGGREW